MPIHNPGLFKTKNIQAGSYVFVEHKLVPDTIEKAWKYYEYIQDPVAKA